MAKRDLDRLKRRAGFSGEKLSLLMSKILFENSETIGKNVSKMNHDSYNKKLKSIKRAKGQPRIIVPEVDEVLINRAVSLAKAAEKGRLMSEDLRGKLSKDLQDSLLIAERGGFLKRRSQKAGQLNEKLIQQLEKQMTATFENYTKKDPSLGVPSNVRTIAVTEFRTTAGVIKREYARQLVEKNPDTFRMTKRWIKNNQLSLKRANIRDGKNGKANHVIMHGVTIPVNDAFLVPGPKRHLEAMDHPHDPQASAGQVIGCHCDIVYSASLFPEAAA